MQPAVPDDGLEGVELATVDGRSDLRAQWRLPADHPILPGHFPGAPLVPGVLLLDAVRRACERAFARPFAIQTVQDVRFLQPLRPAAVVALSAQVQPLATPGVCDLDVEGQWTASGSDERMATFRLRLGAPQA